MVPAWLSWAPSAPDQLWSNLLMIADPSGGSPKLQVGVVWMGAPSGVDALLAPLFSAVGSQPSGSATETVPFGHAIYVEGGCASFSQAACHLPSQEAGGALFAPAQPGQVRLFQRPARRRRGHHLDCRDHARQSAGGLGAVGIDAYGGAIVTIGSLPGDGLRAPLKLASAQYERRVQPRHPDCSAVGQPGLARLLVQHHGSPHGRIGLPELHRRGPARLGPRLLRGQPRPPHAGQEGLGSKTTPSTSPRASRRPRCHQRSRRTQSGVIWIVVLAVGRGVW